MFVHGTDFDRVYETSKGPIGILAEIEIQGQHLVLRDLMIYPAESSESLHVGVQGMLKILRSVEAEARMDGFKECVIIAKRLSGSNPGRMIERKRTLR